MNDELNKMLNTTKVPERSPGYWEHFPKRVSTAIAGRPGTDATTPSRGWLWAAGLVTAGLAVALGVWFHSRPPVAVDYAKIYREVAALFPNQVQSIIADAHGVRVVLAETPDVPASPPLLVEACNPAGCRHVITFSGQQIKINGDAWDVLVNAQNQVLVAGRTTDRYRISARKLGGAS
jgi:hypothetical protein